MGEGTGSSKDWGYGREKDIAGSSGTHRPDQAETERDPFGSARLNRRLAKSVSGIFA